MVVLSFFYLEIEAVDAGVAVSRQAFYIRWRDLGLWNFDITHDHDCFFYVHGNTIMPTPLRILVPVKRVIDYAVSPN